MITYACDDAQRTPATHIGLNAQGLSNALKQLGLGSHGPESVSQWDTPTLNKYMSYKELFVGQAPEPPEWYVRDKPNDQAAYIPFEGGQGYQITQAWRQMTYAEARKRAKSILTQYYISYALSEFTAAGIPFNVTADSQMLWALDMIATLMDKVRNIEKSLTDPVHFPIAVIDKDDNPHTVPDLDSWFEPNGFYHKFRNLSVKGSEYARATWGQVVLADPEASPPGGGTPDVVTAIDTLFTDHPIPGT